LIAKLNDGTVVESTRDSTQAFSFTVGRKQVVRGLDIGIKTMRCGEIAKFTIDSEFAYGTNGCLPSVQWKLIDITNKKDGRVRKRIITPGVGYDMPHMGSNCDINIIAKYDNNVLEDNVFTKSL
jgi:hypothetical protein